MAKYNIVELSIKEREIVDFDNLSISLQNALRNNNAIYVYYGTKSKKVYVGQTKNFVDRHRQHYDGTEEKFNIAKFDKVLVAFSAYFNRSALDDVESQLITYFVADNSNSRQENVGYDNDVINRTNGNTVNEYIEREKVASEVIIPLWEKELYGRGWVKNKTLDELRTKALFKYSPIKILTNEQNELINEILNNSSTSYVINGDAGTGKTVLLTHLVARLVKDKPNISIGVVVQPNWEKTGNDIFKVFGLNNSRLTVTTSTKLITDGQKYDVIIVDESHKLSRNHGKQHPSFMAVYKDEFESHKSHLEIIQTMANQVILMYDILQVIRPANITREMFAYLTKGYQSRFLKTQFRIQTPKGKTYTSDDYINGIKYLLYKDTGLLDSKLTNYNPNFDREVFKDKSSDAYFGYFTERPLYNSFEWIEEDRNFNPEHVNRVLGGLVEDWRQAHGKDESVKHWFEGNLSKRWNSTQENWINSKEVDAEDQIGSVFAVQGIDLNKVAVLIGKDLQIDKEGKLYADPQYFYNVNGKFTKEEMEIEDNKFEFTLFVLNIYYVLLTRGIDGVRVGFWHNDDFRKYLEKTLEIDK